MALRTRPDVQLSVFSNLTRGIGWKTTAVRLLTAIYSHNLTCSSVNILCHTSGLSLLCAHTVSRSPIWKRYTQSPLGSEGKRETSGCRPEYLIICAVVLGLFKTNSVDQFVSWEGLDEALTWDGWCKPWVHLSKLGHVLGLCPGRQYHLKKGH